MRKATFLLLLLISLTGFGQHKTYRNDIFKPGTKANPTWYYAPSGEDFMSKWGLLPGDTVAFKIGANGEDYMNNVDLGNAKVNGITFINDASNTKPFQLGWFGMGANCMNVSFMGNGSKSVQYGFNLFDPLHMALSWQCVGNLEAAWFTVDGAGMGAQLVAIPGVVYPVNYQKFYLHDVEIRNVKQEAVYVGYVHYDPDVLMDFTARRIKIRNSGRDGIQTRNTSKTLIEDNDIDSVGMLHDYGHDHGILLGDNIDGAVVRNNVLKNVQGIGIWADGWGTVNMECNTIQAVNWGIMTRNIAVLNGENTDPQNIGYVHYTLKNNTITPGNGVTMESYFDGQGKTATIEAYNNQCPDKFNLASGITFLHNNNTLTIIPQCTANIPVPLPVTLESFTAVRKGKAILIQWKASESAFDHYELEKSTNGVIYSLNARVAGGQTNYSVYDYFPSETNYYRLKMIDQNGSYSYSKVVVVSMAKGNKLKAIYNLAGVDMGADQNKLKKGFYIAVYEDGSKEYLMK
jgi:hypothetical protein